MYGDYYAHLYFDDPKLATEMVEDDDFNPDDVAAMVALNKPDDWETLK